MIISDFRLQSAESYSLDFHHSKISNLKSAISLAPVLQKVQKFASRNDYL